MKTDFDNLKKYLGESAIFLAIVTACLYISGYSFYASYFYRLSVPLKFLNLQIIDYMSVSFLPISFLIILLLIFFGLWSHEPKNRLEALGGNLFLFVAAILTIYEGKSIINDETFLFIYIILIIVCILIFVIMSYMKISFAYNLFKSPLSFKLSFLIFCLSLLIILSSILGDSAAENLIQVKGDQLEIQFFLKDNTDTQFQNKTFKFVMQLEDRYYVLEKNDTVHDYPKLYIIPTDQVAMATVHRVNN
ncbi:MAG: hypothetical protein O8C61_13210 [Candidatus Methanoperedens sp.]|nr:hypothetical protein [Candidatus Methanoperedens sp.]